MRNRLLPYLIIFVVAIAAGTLIVTWSTLANVSACVQAPGCIDRGTQPRGVLTTRNYGFPVVYKQTVTFAPTNNDPHARNYAGYASATATLRPLSWLYLAVNVVFWYALLYSLYVLLRKLGIPLLRSSVPRETSNPEAGASA